MEANNTHIENLLDWLVQGLDFDEIIEAQIAADDLNSIDMKVVKAGDDVRVRLDIGLRYAVRQVPRPVLQDWIASLDTSRLLRDCGMYRIENSSFISSIDLRNGVSLLSDLGVHYAIASPANWIDLVFHKKEADRSFRYL